MTKKQSLLPAIILILLGLWFLLDNLGFNLPDVGQLWPVFIVFGGLSALWSYFTGQNRDPGQIFVGIIALGVGVFFFLFTFNLRIPIFGRIAWDDMSRLWPAFVLIGGAAFIGQFIFGGFRDRSLLGWGFLALAIGVVSFAFTLGFLDRALGLQVLQFWPLLLIVIGLGILAQWFFRRR
jgi:hypothetical protein